MKTLLIVLLLIVVVLVVLGVAGVMVLNKRQKSSTAAANVVVPGQSSGAPASWAHSHDPEARLHRRLRDVVTALHTTNSIDSATTIVLRADIEQFALNLDNYLVAISKLPPAHKPEQLATVTRAVDQLEEGVAQYTIAAAQPDTAAIEASMLAVRGQLTQSVDLQKSLNAAPGA